MYDQQIQAIIGSASVARGQADNCSHITQLTKLTETGNCKSVIYQDTPTLDRYSGMKNNKNTKFDFQPVITKEASRQQQQECVCEISKLKQGKLQLSSKKIASTNRQTDEQSWAWMDEWTR